MKTVIFLTMLVMGGLAVADTGMEECRYTCTTFNGQVYCSYNC
jgi:hypothetical protein